ncbi:hypothetical protein FJNA_02310 [Thermus sp. FJN-A]
MGKDPRAYLALIGALFLALLCCLIPLLASLLLPFLVSLAGWFGPLLPSCAFGRDCGRSKPKLPVYRPLLYGLLGEPGEAWTLSPYRMVRSPEDGQAWKCSGKVRFLGA